MRVQVDWVRSLAEVVIRRIVTTRPGKQWQQKWAYSESRSPRRRPLNGAEIPGDILWGLLRTSGGTLVQSAAAF
jgi:hypothetical protein